MADDEDASEWEFESGEVATDSEANPSEEELDEDSEWRFSLSDLEEDDEDGDEKAGDDGDEQSAGGGNVFGSMSSDTEIIEPGSPDLKNAVFVLAGVFLALVFFLQFYFLIG